MGVLVDGQTWLCLLESCVKKGCDKRAERAHTDDTTSLHRQFGHVSTV